MADLLERIREIRGEDRLVPMMEEVKTQIAVIPKIDTDAIIRDLHNAFLSMFNTQNTISEERKSQILEEINKLPEAFEEEIEELTKKHNKALSLVADVIKGLQKEIQAIEIPETDLSSIESAIKSIKPTSTKELETKINELSMTIAKLNNKKQKMPDLKPILDAMNKTKTVTFEVETDQYDFPVRVVARETNGS